MIAIVVASARIRDAGLVRHAAVVYRAQPMILFDAAGRAARGDAAAGRFLELMKLALT